MLRRLFIFLLFLFSVAAKAQTPNDSCTLEISLLTCAPGTDLYSLFGHTAIRIRDQRRGMDIVYNYGTFDDEDALFYFHFTRGIMVYSLSADIFSNFIPEYEEEHRGIIEQVLNLNCNQKRALYESLRENSTENKRYYNYQFYKDNCTTRAGKIIAEHSRPLVIDSILPNPSPTYRQMIHTYLEHQQQWWPEFGIDMLLGSNLDKKPDNEQAMYFLPDYLMEGFDHAHTSTGPLVLKKQSILAFPEIPIRAAWVTPFAVFGMLFLLCIVLAVAGKAPAKKILQILDISLFSLLGLIGLVMLYVWLFRVDEVCRNNINIAWALPTHIAAVFFLRRNPKWLKYYFLVTGLLSAILLIGFAWWPQQMNSAVVLLLTVIIFRSIHQFIKLGHAKNHSVPESAGSV